MRGDGRITIYQRGKTGVWQCKVKVPGATGHRIKSCDTTRQSEATAFAINLYDELYFHVKQGGSIKSSPTFQSVYDEWIKYEGRKEITDRVAVYALPFFAKDTIAKIGKSRLTDFWLHRRNTFKKKKPSDGTLLREKTAMTNLWRYAKAKGYITEVPDLNPLEITSPYKRRNTFTAKEWQRLLELDAVVDRAGRRRGHEGPHPRGELPRRPGEHRDQDRGGPRPEVGGHPAFGAAHDLRGHGQDRNPRRRLLEGRRRRPRPGQAGSRATTSSSSATLTAKRSGRSRRRSRPCSSTRRSRPADGRSTRCGTSSSPDACRSE